VSETTPVRWLPIPGFDGYLVSDTGLILGKRRKLLALWPGKAGYLQIGLMCGKERRHFRVHQLVMLAFVGPCPEGMEIRHLDGNPANCALSNLAYGTSAENTQDQIRHGRHNRACATHCIHGHEFTTENTYWWGGKRHCRTCANRRVAEYNARRAAG
jgi:hypothetical protein